MRPRQVWGAGVLVAAVALLGIIVVAADGQPLVGPDSSDSLDLGTQWRSALVAVGAVALLAGIVVVVLSLLTQPRRAKPVWKSRHTWIVWLVALLLGFVAFVVLRPNDRERQDAAVEQGADGSSGDEVAAQRAAPPAWALLALGGVVVGALVGAAALGRRLQPSPEGDASAIGTVRAALQFSLDDLEQEGDARSAIVAAYARLLQAFEACGIARTDAETPLEHLQRGLAAVPIRPGPAQELTELFLEARFSTHPLGEPERERALRAFREARDDLAGHADTVPNAVPPNEAAHAR